MVLKTEKKIFFFRTMKTLQSTEKLSAGTVFIRFLLFMIDQKKFKLKKNLNYSSNPNSLVLWSLSNLSFSYFLFLTLSTELKVRIEFLEDQPFHLVQFILVPTVVILRHPVSPLYPYTIRGELYKRECDFIYFFSPQAISSIIHLQCIMWYKHVKVNFIITFTAVWKIGDR